MSKHTAYKLQILETSWPHGTVATSKWLEEIGISRNLMNRYKQSNWVKSIGHGAFARTHEKIDWYGGVYALQQQLGLDVHIGGKTALEIHGLSHYLSLGQMTIDILKAPKTIIPKWFFQHQWIENIRTIQSNLLPPKLGIVDKPFGNISIKVSSRERATLELIHLAPRLYAFDEVPLLMNSLGSLRADVLTDLLAHCSSEKVKRLLLYFGEIQDHAWYKHIDQNKLVIGRKFLKIIPNHGKYIAKYNIFIPKDYLKENESEILY